MGLLNTILSSGKEHSDIVMSYTDAEIRPTAKYKQKYTQMESEGKKIDWYEYRKSIDAGWPYPVATEAESDAIESSTVQVLRGHAVDISGLITKYYQGVHEDSSDTEFTVYRDLEKAGYWKQVLIDGATAGNRAYQATLIAINGKGGKMYGWINDEEFSYYEKLYKDALLRDAESGNPEAQYAVAEFCLGNATYGTDLRRAYADAAMRAGVTDAAYLRAEIYKSDMYSQNGATWEFGDLLQYYAFAANNTTGAMLGFIQDCIGDAYADGEGGFPKDIRKAIYYYTLAEQNGSSSAKISLEYYSQHPETIR